MSKIFKYKDYSINIYVEDTDFQGFVYHANYIKFFERSRSDFLSSNNISQEILRKNNLGFVIKRIEIDYLFPAKLGDVIVVKSFVEKKSNARMIFNQKIILKKDETPICKGLVEVCLINIDTKKPKPLPNDLLLIFDED